MGFAAELGFAQALEFPGRPEDKEADPLHPVQCQRRVAWLQIGRRRFVAVFPQEPVLCLVGVVGGRQQLIFCQAGVEPLPVKGELFPVKGQDPRQPVPQGVSRSVERLRGCGQGRHAPAVQFFQAPGILVFLVLRPGKPELIDLHRSLKVGPGAAEASQVVPVLMGHDDDVQVVVRHLGNVGRDFPQPCRAARVALVGPAVDEHVASRVILCAERQEKAIPETGVVHADRHTRIWEHYRTSSGLYDRCSRAKGSISKGLSASMARAMFSK